MDGRVRVGIVGSQFISSIHAHALQRCAAAELFAVASPTKDHARRFAERHHIPHDLTDYRKMLEMEEIDMIVIGAPNDLHCAITVDAARAGKLDYSPEGSVTCPQIFFDPILVETARGVPALSMRFRTRLESFEQDADGVRARITDLDTGRTETLAASYLVGCDGAGSTVRRPMKLASQTTTSTASPMVSAVRWRALVLSCTTTRESFRSFQASWPWPTSTACTRAAPRASNTSVNPPVEAPTSRRRGRS